MKELLRSNDLVFLSFIQALLSEAGIDHVVMDSHMSVMEGSLGILPRRLMVDADRFAEAERLLADADVTQAER